MEKRKGGGKKQVKLKKLRKLYEKWKPEFEKYGKRFLE